MKAIRNDEPTVPAVAPANPATQRLQVAQFEPPIMEVPSHRTRADAVFLVARQIDELEIRVSVWVSATPSSAATQRLEISRLPSRARGSNSAIHRSAGTHLNNFAVAANRWPAFPAC